MADAVQSGAVVDDKVGPVGWAIPILALGAAAWFFNSGTGAKESLTTESLMARLRDGGVSCTSPDIDTMEGSAFHDFGRCRTDDGPVDVFVHDDPEANLGGLTPKIAELYGPGKYAVWGSGWFIVTAEGSGHAAELQDAVGGNVQSLDVFGGSGVTGGTVTGDLDCTSPGVGTNIPVQPGDPHGFDADGDGIGCET